MASPAGMVSSGVPVPVVQAVDDAVATQVPPSVARTSVTTTFPSRLPEIVPPGLPEPRSALVGAVMVSPPTLTEKVTVVSGSPPVGAAVVPPGAAGDAAAGVGVAEACVAADAAAGASPVPMVIARPMARRSDARNGSPDSRAGQRRAFSAVIVHFIYSRGDTQGSHTKTLRSGKAGTPRVSATSLARLTGLASQQGQ